MSVPWEWTPGHCRAVGGGSTPLVSAWHLWRPLSACSFPAWALVSAFGGGSCTDSFLGGLGRAPGGTCSRGSGMWVPGWPPSQVAVRGLASEGCWGVPVPLGTSGAWDGRGLASGTAPTACPLGRPSLVVTQCLHQGPVSICYVPRSGQTRGRPRLPASRSLPWLLTDWQSKCGPRSPADTGWWYGHSQGLPPPVPGQGDGHRAPSCTHWEEPASQLAAGVPRAGTEKSMPLALGSPGGIWHLSPQAHCSQTHP